MTLPSTPYQRFAYPVLRSLDAEAAHHHALTALQTLQRNSLALAILRQLYTVRHPRLERTLFGVRFANPVGVAAGFDKNGVAVEALAALGFGHIEVGTVTPRPQRGNERPRLVRLIRDEALINRLGFPNEGMHAIIPHLPPRGTRTFVLGINIGPNKTSVTAGRAIDDYLAALDYCAPVADYFAINISSPNTPGLRSLQQAQSLDDLLTSIFRHTSNERISTPIAVKLGPDLTRDDLCELVRVLMAHPVAAVIATNTTSSRPASLRDPLATESGGLSGRPLRDLATAVIRTISDASAGKLPVIGVGGVFSARDAHEKLEAGATLVQLYTGFVYIGPSTARRINEGLLSMKRIRQRDTKAVARSPLPQDG